MEFIEVNIWVILIIAVIIGIIPAIIANSKGYNFFSWWFFGFFLFIVALPLSIVLKKSLKDSNDNFSNEINENDNFSNIIADLANLKAIKDTGALSEEAYRGREDELKKQLQAIENAKQMESQELKDFYTQVENIKNSELTDNEKKTIISMIDKLESGNVITKHSINNKIETRTIEAYQDWIKYYGKNSLILIAKKK